MSRRILMNFIKEKRSNVRLMRAHVFLNLLNELMKRSNARFAEIFFCFVFLATNSIQK